MSLLTRIIEPNRLLLVWQESENSTAPYNAGGRRYIVGELTRESVTSNDIRLRYFTGEADFDAACSKGFDGYPAFKIQQEIHTHDVMAAFARRIPSKARGDFADYLGYWRISLDAGQNMSPFALLGYTGGVLPGDGFSLIHTFEEATPPCELVIEVAGVRHYPAAMQMIEAKTLEGRQVEFVREPSNAHDANAICLMVDGDQIGYIKKGQADFFTLWLGKANFSAHVERVNGRQEKPSILIFISVS
jgi:hypothetical protein